MSRKVMGMKFPQFTVSECEDGTIEFSNSMGWIYLEKEEVKNLIRFLEISEGAKVEASNQNKGR